MDAAASTATFMTPLHCATRIAKRGLLCHKEHQRTMVDDPDALKNLPPEPEAFIFDLFGVLISFDNDIVYARLAKHCADREDAFKRLNGLMSSRDVITGKVTLPQIYESLVEGHGLSLDYEGFVDAWVEPYSIPIPGMAELIRSLSSNYRLLLLSNVDTYDWEAIRPAHPELSYFHALLVSCDLGIAKPDSAIFEQASRVAESDPSHCLFVDDTLENIEAAHALGFQTHWFDRLETLRDQLVRRNIRGL